MVKSPGNTTYYIDSKAGDDAAKGTIETEAWKSFAKLNTVRFAPGDTIWFKAGTNYVGQFKPKGSGTKDAPIAVKSHGDGAPPRIDCQAKALSAVHLYNVEYFELNDLEITNTGERRQPKRRGVLVQGENVGDMRGIVLRNLFIHDVNGSVVVDGMPKTDLWGSNVDAKSPAIGLDQSSRK